MERWQGDVRNAGRKQRGAANSDRRHQPSAYYSRATGNPRWNNQQRSRRWRRNQNRPQSNRGMNEVDHSSDAPRISYGSTYVEESDIPGYAFDPVTKRYYKLQPQSSGSNIGFRESDLRENRRRNLFAAARDRCIVGAHPSVSWLPKMVHRRELFGSNMPRYKRLVTEEPLRGIRKEPTYIQKGNVSGEALQFCRYVSISDDGKTIFGCWSVTDEGSRDPIGSRFICFKVVANRKGRMENESWSKAGLKIGDGVHGADLLKEELTDVSIEAINENVTCSLYSTVQTVFTMQNRFATLSRVCIQPIADLSAINDPVVLGAPAYNMRYTCTDCVRSVALNRNRMEIGVGMDSNALLLDIATGRSTSIDSFSKTVLCLTFSFDETLLFMGLLNDNVVCSDLRMSNRDIVARFDDTKSAPCVRALRTKPGILFTEDYFGVMKFWDTRTRKPIFTITDGKHPYVKTPMYIDKDERIILSATSDGITRGWSIYNGEKLCEFPSHDPADVRQKPQLAYASNWGGIVGNAAVLVITTDEFRIHELML